MDTNHLLAIIVLLYILYRILDDSDKDNDNWRHP